MSLDATLRRLNRYLEPQGLVVRIQDRCDGFRRAMLARISEPDTEIDYLKIDTAEEIENFLWAMAKGIELSQGMIR